MSNHTVETPTQPEDGVWTMGPDGELAPLDLGSLPVIDADAIAVCLLFSFRFPEHELAVAEELRRLYPAAHVVASQEVAPEFREYERASTTGANEFAPPGIRLLISRSQPRS